MSDVELTGQRHFSATVQVPDANAPDVIFSFSVICAEQIIAESEIRISAGQRAAMKTAIPPRFGKATIHLTSEIATGWASNDYATAIFHDAKIE